MKCKFVQIPLSMTSKSKSRIKFCKLKKAPSTWLDGKCSGNLRNNDDNHLAISHKRLFYNSH